ncbi:unnamed protein product [Calicophoron daubneyi]|uniref:ELMO domain-containing protein n=1 Tax=Calicophoron daubneyi TaxID=300641 RepID=A0AAV2TPL5_CALDB
MILRSVLFIFWGFYCYLIRPIVKHVLRRITSKCELLRLTSTHARGAALTSAVEHSMKLSRSPSVRRCLEWSGEFDYDKRIQDIVSVKGINPEFRTKFSSDMEYCLKQIHSYAKVVFDAEVLKSTRFDLKRSDHCALLDQLWSSLGADYTDGTKERKWSLLGFQSNDPSTDFRGMGLLSLGNMIYFSCKYTDLARSCLSASNHPERWYPFSVVGINLTEMMYVFLKNGDLKNQLYNMNPEPTLKDFQETYSFIFAAFHNFWMASPKDIMQFNVYREQFRRGLERRLRSTDCKLAFSLLDQKYSHKQ